MMRSLVLGMTAGLLALLSTVYLVNTFLYLAPPNPLKVRWLPFVMMLEDPLFTQNWHLFAPNPIRSNFVLTVRCRAQKAVTSWRDATSPLLARHHRARTSPMARLLRVQQNAIRMVLGWSGDEWKPLVCRRDRSRPYCRGDDPSTKQRQEMGRLVLRAVGGATCDQVLGRGRTKAMQLRILMHTPPPWSQRDLPAVDGSTQYIVLPWEAYESW